MNTKQQNTTNHAVSSSPSRAELVAAVASKETTVRELGRAVDSWNFWILITLLLAAAAAASILFVQRKQFQAAAKLATAQEDLGRAKEAVQQFDTNAANEKAGEAYEQAGKFALEAEQLRKDNLI